MEELHGEEGQQESQEQLELPEKQTNKFTSNWEPLVLQTKPSVTSPRRSSSSRGCKSWSQ